MKTSSWLKMGAGKNEDRRDRQRARESERERERERPRERGREREREKGGPSLPQTDQAGLLRTRKRKQWLTIQHACCDVKCPAVDTR